MSLSSALNAGVAGLSVNATRLAVISDNIANSSTNGYRRVDVDFASLVTPSGSNSFSAGGVAVATFRDVVSSGSLISTGNSTDISASGRGMLPVTTIETVGLSASQRPFQMVGTGSFSRDENGYLTTRSGLALLGWPTDAGLRPQHRSHRTTYRAGWCIPKPPHRSPRPGSRFPPREICQSSCAACVSPNLAIPAVHRARRAVRRRSW